jgi:hypothetical protein
MSDQPDSNTGTSSVSAAALRDTRWLAGGIWGGLLLALVVTSVYGINSFTQGSLASRYLGLPLQNASPNEKVAAAVGMIASGVAALILLAAWRSFATMTNVLVGALAGSSDAADDSPAPADWLLPDVNGGVFTRVGEVVQFVGFAWAVMIATPALLSLATAFS